MGYTTTFQGQFHCYRVESAMAGQFLKAIYNEEPAALAAFADWLTDQGDPRGSVVAALVATDDRAAFWRLFALSPEQVAYLHRFGSTRRMKLDADVAATLDDPERLAVGLPVGPEGAYFVGLLVMDDDRAICDPNSPPERQPGLWCQWVPSEDGTAIVWDGVEKFYHYDRWLAYLIEHFLAPWGFLLNGSVIWQGENDGDQGTLRVYDNKVEASPRRR